jgi:hypothetical protein
MRTRRDERPRRTIGALVTLDALGTLAQIAGAARARPGSRSALGAAAAVSALGVACASPVLVRVARSGRARDARRALRTVDAGLAFHTVGCLAVLLATRPPARERLVVAAVLAGGDAVTLGYRRELRRLLEGR